ncbi:MAG: PRC-barrel domain-containing protein [Ilumatobacteraceae bacterium]
MTYANDGDRNRPDLATDEWIARRVLDVTGEPIGVVVDLHPGGPDARPEWLAVSTGLLSTPVAVPIRGSVRVGDDVVIAHDRHVVFTAPGDLELLTIDAAAERAIAAHFGLAAPTVGASTA